LSEGKVWLAEAILSTDIETCLIYLYQNRIKKLNEMLQIAAMNEKLKTKN